MQIEEYFDFLAPDDIRLKGTRVGIESVLYEYIHNARTPEEIKARFGTITLEQVYAAILYYLHNRDSMDAYLTDWLEFGRRARAEQECNPPPFLQTLRRLQAERETAKTDFSPI